MSTESYFGAAADLVLRDFETPADPEHPDADRWAWFGGLYASPEWGLVTVIPNLPPIAFGRISRACNAIVDRASSAEQWEAIKELAQAGLLASPPNGALNFTWSAVLDTCIDAFDHLAGREFVGNEAIMGAVLAVRIQHSEAAAARFAANAIDAWTDRRETRPAGAA